METRGLIAEALVKALRSRKILTIDDLCAIAQRTPPTVWRILKPVGYYTSFNCNAKFYTLAETPRFDANNLWFFRKVGFSSYGSLTRTLVGLVQDSKMGMTQNELSALLQVRVQNQLFHLFVQKKLARTDWGRAHVYLSVDQETREQQLRRHKKSREQEAVRRREGMPSDSETIAILAELVRRPHTTARHIAALLSARELPITRQQVLAVIDKYDLRKKRASRRSRS
jgi:hypothetical protein